LLSTSEWLGSGAERSIVQVSKQLIVAVVEGCEETQRGVGSSESTALRVREVHISRWQPSQQPVKNEGGVEVNTST
jgi:hypothetical protein